LLFIIVLAHVNAIKNEFLDWDDNVYVTENPYIKVVSLENIKHLVMNFYVGEWFPLQMLSYLLDYQLWGMNTTGFHITNLCFHLFSSYLIFLLFKNLGYKRDESLVAGILFATFPPSVEAVAWISQRKSVMNMFFLLLTCLMYLNAFNNGIIQKKSYCISIVSHFLSLLCKSTSIPLPGVFMVYETIVRGPLGLKSFLRGLKRSIPYLIISFVFLVIFIYGQHEAGVARNYDLGGIWHAVVIFLVSPFFWFTSRIFLPVKLNAFYPPLSYDTITNLQIVLSCIIWGGVIIPLLIWWRKRPLKLFWAFFYFVALIPGSIFAAIVLPTTNTETASGGGDRHLYYVCLTFIGIICAGLNDLIRKREELLKISIVLFIACYTLLTVNRNYVWHDDISLWSDSVKKSPDYFFNQFKAGTAYLNKYYREKADQYIDMAIYHLKKAVELNPEVASFHFKLGEALEARKDYESALTEYRRSIRKDLPSPYPYEAIGRVYYLMGRKMDALQTYSDAVKVIPDYYPLWNKKGIIEMELGLFDSAISSLQNSLRLNYNQYNIHRNLGAMYLKKNDLPSALLHFEESFRQNPAQENVEILLQTIMELKKTLNRR